MQNSAVYRGLLLALLPLGAHATPLARPDTTGPPRTHALKLGLRTTTYQGLLPTVGYEWQLRPGLSLQTSLGYNGSTWHGGYDYVNADNTITSYRFTQQERRFTAAAELRYYFQRRRPALTGWYAGVGLTSTYTHLTFSPSTLDQGTSGSVTLWPNLRLGRQWALGRRLLLDTFLGLDARQYNYYSPSWRNRWQFSGAAGVQLGYRF